MKVTMLSFRDYAGSAYKMWEAISQNTDVDIELFTGSHANKLGHPIRTLVTDLNRAEVQERIDSSDVLHFKGDWPPNDGYLGLKVSHKPIIITTSGGFFRKKGPCGGLGRYSVAHYGNVTQGTSFEPDLLYPEFSDIWTPHPIDSYDKVIEWKKPEVPILMHMPTTQSKKDTNFIVAVFNELKKNIEVDIRLTGKTTFARAVEMRRESTIFFDQFKVGFYGNSAIEAMQYGIPTAAWISPEARGQAKGSLKGCPIITEPKDINAWVNRIIEILSSDMTELSIKTKQWCDDIHSYQAVAKQWKEIYHGVSRKETSLPISPRHV